MAGRLIGVGAVVALLAAAPVQARLGESYESIRKEISTRADCKNTAKTAEVVIFTCNKDITLWYFTVPGTPAHPGVIKRGFETNKDGGTDSFVDATSFGSDADQPAFKILFDKISELDRQMREYVRQQAAPNAKAK